MVTTQLQLPTASWSLFWGLLHKKHLRGRQGGALSIRLMVASGHTIIKMATDVPKITNASIASFLGTDTWEIHADFHMMQPSDI